MYVTTWNSMHDKMCKPTNFRQNATNESCISGFFFSAAKFVFLNLTTHQVCVL